ncbi:unnamed protein product, partial [Mesorhabditis belari]|uniref:MRG domain-containing protein n=1 Tax=Mesorhabditis belari TaxID=2138241 RepID=A0AAF3FE63_9BILA
MQLKVGNRFLERFPPTNLSYEVIITSVDTDRDCVRIHYHGWSARCDTERTFNFCETNWIPCTAAALKNAKEAQKEGAKRQQEIAAKKKAKTQEKATPRHAIEAVKRKGRPRSQTEVEKASATPRLQTEAVKRKARPRSQTEVGKGSAKKRLQTEVINKVIGKRNDTKIPRSKSLTNITPATTITNNVSLPRQIFLQMQEVMWSPILRNHTIDATLREYLRTYHYLAKDDQEKAGAAQMLVDMFDVHCYEILSKAEAVSYFQAVTKSEFFFPSSYFGSEHLLRFIATQLTFVMENDKNWTNEKKASVFMNMSHFVKFMNENGGRYVDQAQALGNVKSQEETQKPKQKVTFWLNAH